MPSGHREKKARRTVAYDSESDSESQGFRNDVLLAKVEREYLNQPIDLKQGDSKLKQLVGHFNVLKRELKGAAAVLHNVASDVAEVLAEEYRDEDYDEDKMVGYLLENRTMKELDSDFRSVLDRLKEVDIHSSMISDIRQRIVQGHQISDIYQVYLDRVHPLVASYAQQTSRQRFQGNPVYNDFRSLIWENFTEGQGVPNIKKFLPKEIGDEEEDSDEELEIGAQTHDFKCPLTMAICEDPYTSTVCPHSFSGDAIKDYIRQNKGSVPCPVGGCSKTLSLATIEQDEGLRRRVEAHKRRVKEGRTQGTTQGRGRTFVAMEDSDDE
ncbi:hypothetical protein JCM21900_000755 [Sporobolomyces salmonicolor]